MGDKTTLAKARKELEDLYLGVPDESVDLSFKDLTTSFQHNEAADQRKNNMSSAMAPIAEEPKAAADSRTASPLNESPSLDFAKALRQGAKNYQHVEHELYRERLARNSFKRGNKAAPLVMVESSKAYDDVSCLSMASALGGEPGRKRRRPGIPHCNICALCGIYIYIFRHRCLVCGRVYCRSCVGMGMGEMSEGRKCVECLGRRFSQRYIKRAGLTGCCWRYPSRVKMQELMWAEKGPRRSGERQYRSGANSSAMRSPVMPGSPRVLPASRLGSPRPAPGSPMTSHISHDSFIMSSIRSPSPHGFPL